jgi:hypothetical protein
VSKAGQEVRADAMHEIPVAPRSRVKMIPRPLEAICLKALSFKPADRYLSAKALAQDVTRWLADEPVSVIRDPLLVRVRRWERRHQAIVPKLSFILAIVYCVVMSVFVFLMEGSRQHFRQESERIQREHLLFMANSNQDVQFRNKAQSFMSWLASSERWIEGLAESNVGKGGNGAAEVLCDIAGLYALAAGLESDPIRADDLSARSVRLLRRAAEKGFNDADRLLSNRALDSLHKRDDFKNLLNELRLKAVDRK